MKNKFILLVIVSLLFSCGIQKEENISVENKVVNDNENNKIISEEKVNEKHIRKEILLDFYRNVYEKNCDWMLRYLRWDFYIMWMEKTTDVESYIEKHWKETFCNFVPSIFTNNKNFEDYIPSYDYKEYVYEDYKKGRISFLGVSKEISDNYFVEWDYLLIWNILKDWKEPILTEEFLPYWSIIFSKDSNGYRVKVLNAIISTDNYKRLNKYFGIDDNNVYYINLSNEQEIIYWVDQNSFEVIDFDLNDSAYAKDMNNIYKRSSVIEWADINSFNILDHIYAKDKNNVYKWISVMEWVDSNSFEILNVYITKDKNNVYYGWEILEWVDVVSFDIIGDGIIYQKDKNNIYYGWKILEWADVVSFEVINDKYAKDKNNCYKNWKLLDSMERCENASK